MADYGTPETKDTGTNDGSVSPAADTEPTTDTTPDADGAPVPAEEDAAVNNLPEGFVNEDGVIYNPEFASPAEALAQAQEDIDAVNENPDVANVRAAEPEIGGESFNYGGKPVKD